MTIVNPDIINKWEMELIESLTADLEVREVRRLFENKYGLRLKENLEFDRGRIATFNNQIAYEFRFKAIAFCPLVIDRTGNFQGFGRTNEKDAVHADRPGSDTMLSDPEVIRKKERELINAIASDLNTDGLGTLFGQEFKVQILGEPQFQSGDLVVFKGHAGFQLNFEMAIHFSILVGRNGNYLHFDDFNHPRVSAENAADPDARNQGPDNEARLNITHEP
jgi:hypothetical protein